MVKDQNHGAGAIITQLPSKFDKLLVSGEFPGFSPEILFGYWIQPDILCRWWPQEAEVVPQRGGTYRLSWPQMNWVLHGKITDYQPGELFAFTWKWEHTPQIPERYVRITFASHSTKGTQLIVEHASYTNTNADQEERDSHLEGWLYFLARLSTLQP